MAIIWSISVCTTVAWIWFLNEENACMSPRNLGIAMARCFSSNNLAHGIFMVVRVHPFPYDGIFHNVLDRKDHDRAILDMPSPIGWDWLSSAKAFDFCAKWLVLRWALRGTLYPPLEDALLMYGGYYFLYPVALLALIAKSARLVGAWGKLHQNAADCIESTMPSGVMVGLYLVGLTGFPLAILFLPTSFFHCLLLAATVKATYFSPGYSSLDYCGLTDKISVENAAFTGACSISAMLWLAFDLDYDTFPSYPRRIFLAKFRLGVSFLAWIGFWGYFAMKNSENFAMRQLRRNLVKLLSENQNQARKSPIVKNIANGLLALWSIGRYFLGGTSLLRGVLETLATSRLWELYPALMCVSEGCSCRHRSREERSLRSFYF